MLGKSPLKVTLNALSHWCYHIATVQTSEEYAPVIRDNSVAAGLEWLWVPFVHPSSESPTEDTHLHQYLHELSQMLTEGARYSYIAMAHSTAVAFCSMHFALLPYSI